MGVHAQMDTIRVKFFWSGDIDKFKYHMVKWENVCLPRDFGGAGIINTRHLYEALMLKWVWRMQNLEEDDTYCKLLKAKYFPNNAFMRTKGTGGSQFWKGVQKVKNKIRWGAVNQVNNGEQTLFWGDTWMARFR
jgi:hypothetical protein